jgi:hypothetical protein
MLSSQVILAKQGPVRSAELIQIHFLSYNMTAAQEFEDIDSDSTAGQIRKGQRFPVVSQRHVMNGRSARRQCHCAGVPGSYYFECLMFEARPL